MIRVALLRELGGERAILAVAPVLSLLAIFLVLVQSAASTVREDPGWIHGRRIWMAWCVHLDTSDDGLQHSGRCTRTR